MASVEALRVLSSLCRDVPGVLLPPTAGSETSDSLPQEAKEMGQERASFPLPLPLASWTTPGEGGPFQTYLRCN